VLRGQILQVPRFDLAEVASLLTHYEEEGIVRQAVDEDLVRTMHALMQGNPKEIRERRGLWLGPKDGIIAARRAARAAQAAPPLQDVASM
jgi:hypothetical protein